MKQIIIAVIAIIAIIGGAVALGGSETVTAEPSNNYYGQEVGTITIKEYADFECPACAGFYPIVDSVKEQFKDQIRFEYRHFPLVQIHSNATAAHRAAQAASNQGKFWDMHDLLFERQTQWNGQATTSPASIFEEYARELELDMEQFIADTASSETLAIINADVALGKARGYSGTPTFEIDGVQIEDTNTIASVELLTAVIQDALDAKNGVSQDSDNPSPEPETAPVDDSNLDTTPEETETSGE